MLNQMATSKLQKYVLTCDEISTYDALYVILHIQKPRLSQSTR